MGLTKRQFEEHYLKENNNMERPEEMSYEEYKVWRKEENERLNSKKKGQWIVKFDSGFTKQIKRMHTEQLAEEIKKQYKKEEEGILDITDEEIPNQSM